MIQDYFLIGVANLKKRKMRTWLTMLGIFIGIAAVVALISLGQGIQKSVNDQFEKMGVDKLIVTPKGTMMGMGGTGAVTLTKKDAKTIKRTRGVESVAGLLMRTGEIEYRNQVRYFMVTGAPLDEGRRLVEEMFLQGGEIQNGRALKSNEKYKVVLGNLYREGSVFVPNIKVGDKIEINDVDFKVVGFYESFGNTEDDKAISIPEETMRELFDIDDEYDFILAKASAGHDVEEVSEKVEKDLRKSRDVEEDKEDFEIQTFKELMESYTTVLNIIQIFLLGIAAISLIVGGIGIMNTMYTSVLERTREIGIMKSIGAKNSDILTLFLIESGILGLVGGGIGIILGIGFSKLVEAAAKAGGYGMIQVSFPLPLIIGTLMFSFVVGALSGILPARQASKLQPVDALRYE
tara:strand:- start:14089 stop:15306 length:1218 start_codon:yes stop_codon:yes gene_type:complete